MFSSLLSSGGHETIALFVRIFTLEQMEVTCRAAREAVARGSTWTECACRDVAPGFVFPAPGVPRRRVRHVLMTLFADDVSLPTDGLQFPSFRDVEELAEAVSRHRRRAAVMSAPGTTPQIVVNMFKFRPKAAEPGREAALISSKVVVELSRNGRQGLWEFKMSFPVSGGALVWARARPEAANRHVRRARADVAVADAPSSTELYADVFSVGGNGRGAGLQVVDANLREDGSCVNPGFCAVAGAWGPDAQAGAMTDGLMAIICLRELARPPRVSSTVRALDLEIGRLRR